MEAARTRRTSQIQRTTSTPRRLRPSAASPAGPAEVQADAPEYIPALGDRVLVGPSKVPGQLSFIGSTEFSPGEWIGVVLDEALGKNDGTVKGIKYFDCKPNYGLFVRAKQVEPAPSLTVPGSMKTFKVTASEQHKSSEPHVSQQPPSPQEPVASEQQKPTPTMAKAEGTKVADAPKAPGPPKILESSAVVVPPKAAEGLKRGTDSMSSCPEGMDERRAEVQLDLADAVEEHDEIKIRKILPLAYSCGVSYDFIESAHRVLNFRLQRALLKDVDDVREAVASLAASVQEVHAQTQELEQLLPKQVVRACPREMQPSAPANIESVAAESGAGSEVSRDATDLLLRTLGQQFEQQLVPVLEQRMAEIVQQVVAEATKELREAAVDMKQVRAGYVCDTSCQRLEEQDAAGQALHDPTLAEQEAAAIRIQALNRGCCARREMQARHDAAVCIQRRVRAKGTAGVHQRSVILHAEQRHSDWLEVFHSFADSPGPSLGQRAFSEALQQVHQQLSQGQVQVLWAGHLRNTGHCFVDLEGFVGVAEAVGRGATEAADWADVSPEIFELLGADNADAAATKLQAVYRGQRVRMGRAEVCPSGDAPRPVGVEGTAATGCGYSPTPAGYFTPPAGLTAGHRTSAPSSQLALAVAPDGGQPAPAPAPCAGAACGRRASVPVGAEGTAAGGYFQPPDSGGVTAGR